MSDFILIDDVVFKKDQIAYIRWTYIGYNQAFEKHEYNIQIVMSAGHVEYTEPKYSKSAVMRQFNNICKQLGVK
jgi:hypothetical protein